MAINLDKMRAKLSALENRGKKEDSAFLPLMETPSRSIGSTITWARTPASSAHTGTSVLQIR